MDWTIFNKCVRHNGTACYYHYHVDVGLPLTNVSDRKHI